MFLPKCKHKRKQTAHNRTRTFELPISPPLSFLTSKSTKAPVAKMATKQQSSEPYTKAEKDWLKKTWDGEFKFLQAYGLSIYKEVSNVGILPTVPATS
jgi:hypothetical protein